MKKIECECPRFVNKDLVEVLDQLKLVWLAGNVHDVCGLSFVSFKEISELTTDVP